MHPLLVLSTNLGRGLEVLPASAVSVFSRVSNYEIYEIHVYQDFLFHVACYDVGRDLKL